MKFKDVKRYLTINRSEINAYIALVMKARNAYIDERKPTEDVDGPVKIYAQNCLQAPAE